MKHTKRFAIAILMTAGLSLFLTALQAQADTNWPKFRGEDSRGISDGYPLPEKWSSTENVEWKTDIPGRGWSSPIVWGNKIFLTTVVNLGETEDPKKGLFAEERLFKRAKQQGLKVTKKQVH